MKLIKRLFSFKYIFILPVAFAILFLFVSNVEIKGVGLTSRYVTVIVLMLGLFNVLSSKLLINKGVVCFFYFYFLFLLWAIFISLLNVDLVDRLFVPAFSVFLVIVSSYLIVVQLSLKIKKETIFLLLLYIFLIHSIFTVISFLSYDFKELTLGFIVKNGNIDILESFRGSGILSAEGATVSLFLSSGFFLSLYLYLNSENKYSNFYACFFYIIIILAGVFVSGRTGFISFLIALSFVFVYSLRNVLKFKINRKMPFFFVFFPVALFLGGCFFYVIYQQSGGGQTAWGADNLEAAIKWFSSEGDINNNNSTVMILLREHVVINENLWSLLFGDPEFLAGSSNHTDIGYLRIINNFGIIGFIMYYGAFFSLFLVVVNNAKIILDKFFITFLFINYVVLEFKEPFLGKLITVAPLLLICFVILEQNRKEKIRAY